MLNRIIRIAAFQNPEFYKAQAMRLPTWNKPRVISCSEEFAQHIALPRGCLEEVSALLKDHGIQILIRDERYSGQPIAVNFHGNLRDDQAEAVRLTLRRLQARHSVSHDADLVARYAPAVCRAVASDPPRLYSAWSTPSSCGLSPFSRLTA